MTPLNPVNGFQKCGKSSTMWEVYQSTSTSIQLPKLTLFEHRTCKSLPLEKLFTKNQLFLAAPYIPMTPTPRSLHFTAHFTAVQFLDNTVLPILLTKGLRNCPEEPKYYDHIVVMTIEPPARKCLVSRS